MWRAASIVAKAARDRQSRLLSLGYDSRGDLATEGIKPPLFGRSGKAGGLREMMTNRFQGLRSDFR